MKVVLCTIAYSGWYPVGAARLIQSMREHEPGVEIQAFVNVLPFGAPARVVVEGYDYTAYCAKPFVLAAARNDGADIAILVDAAFYAIRSIQPLIQHIARNGYFLCRNGYRVGEWSSDDALTRMGVDRADARQIEEASSYCVGLNFSDGRCTHLLDRWCGFASDRLTFPGPHTSLYFNGRNKGFVSHDQTVRGHRHDQTALSILAYKIGMNALVERPLFTAYAGRETGVTCLVNQGGL